MKEENYVRYKYENCIYIGKIKFIREVMGFEETLQLDIDTCMEEILKEDVIKSSPNIIDLIEVGDIVNYEQLNGGVVLNKKDDSVDTWSILPNSLKNEDIKSVITKEQLKNMEYRLDI